MFKGTWGLGQEPKKLLVGMLQLGHYPRKDGLVVNRLDDLLLQPKEGILALAVDQRYRDREEAHQAVRRILDPRRHPASRPGHFARHRDDGRIGPSKDADVDARDFRQQALEQRLAAEQFPVLGVEDNVPRGDELLQSPPSREPAAVSEFRTEAMLRIDQVGIADGRPAIPRVHGVDGLGQLRAARLVDAAGIDPDVGVALGLGERTCALDFGEALGLPLAGEVY